MKILKIEQGKGHFYRSNLNDWHPIDQIDKDGLMRLLEDYLKNEVETRPHRAHFTLPSIVSSHSGKKNPAQGAADGVGG